MGWFGIVRSGTETGGTKKKIGARRKLLKQTSKYLGIHLESLKNFAHTSSKPSSDLIILCDGVLLFGRTSFGITELAVAKLKKWVGLKHNPQMKNENHG